MSQPEHVANGRDEAASVNGGVKAQIKGFGEVSGSPLILMSSFYKDESLHTDTLLGGYHPDWQVLLLGALVFLLALHGDVVMLELCGTTSEMFHRRSTIR